MKKKKVFSAIFLSLYLIAIYFMLDEMTGHPISVLLTTFASMIFMVITHELGHLIFGYLTGYRFISYRIFSLTLLKENGKFRFCRTSVPGTAGQCLMAPPRKKDGKYPFVLYHLGGILLCGILSLIPMVISIFLISAKPTLGMCLFLFGFVSFVANLLNAIPTNGKSMLNDATNLKLALHNPTAKDALWNQLEYVALNAENISISDMPEELFFIPNQKDLSNPLIFWQILAAVDRAEAMGEYEKAKEIAYFALDHATFIAPLYQSVLQIEAVYLGSILASDPERTEEYYKNIQKNPTLKGFASFYRASYTYLLLVKKDISEAEKILPILLKKIKKAPYQSEANFEQKLLDHIREINN